MKFKIDIFNLSELGDPSSETVYFGSVSGQTKKSVEWFSNFFHFGTEGITVNNYRFFDYFLLEVTGLLMSGNYLREKIYFAPELTITNEPQKEVPFIDKEANDIDYLVISDDHASTPLSDDAVSFLETYPTIIKQQGITEWGTSGFFENYLIGILSSLSSSLIEKLGSFGHPLNSISRFQFPVTIKKQLAKEYNIAPETLFLESYSKNYKIETVTFRNLNHRFYLTINDKKLVSLKTENLNHYI